MSISVQVSRNFAAAPERVFAAWLDPAQACRFLFKTPTGEMTRVEIDARVGGQFIIVERRDGQEAEHFGTYLTIERPWRLAFTFGVRMYSDDDSTVTITLTSAGAGCALTLVNEMDERYAEWAERTAEGWRGILEGLAQVFGEA